MKLLVLDHIATKLDSFAISEFCTIKKDWPSIKNQWKSIDIDVLKIGPIASSQPSFYRFTHGFAHKMISMNFLLTLIYQI